MMKAERIPLQSLLIPGNHDKLVEIGRSINQGAVFVYPTETIYGLGGLAGKESVEEGILLAKRRSPENPMILIGAHESVFDGLGLQFPPAARILAKAFWPGMLTLVLPSRVVNTGVAVRISDHPFLKAVLPFVKSPLVSTSANPSGETYNPDPDIIYQTFVNKINFMIDSATLPPSAPSSVVKVSDRNELSIIRIGAISEKRIRSAILN